MRSKRFKENKATVAALGVTTVEIAVQTLKTMKSVKFDESVELHASIGIDPKKSDQQIRQNVSLPHGTGKVTRVIAFVEPAQETAAKNAGADIIGTEEVIDELVKTGKIDFDVAIATPAMMPKLAKAARVLGPKGLMPNPKTDTVGPQVEKMIKDQKGGKISFKNDSTCNVHITIGKMSFDESKLIENAKVAIDALKKSKPSSSKGIFIKSLYITSTMSPSIALDPNIA
ncbi:MAG: 50S ribosomal protein L1 [Patescibacteria group bacterium]|jgi:large subunit ribosomal protein L1